MRAKKNEGIFSPRKIKIQYVIYGPPEKSTKIGRSRKVTHIIYRKGVENVPWNGEYIKMASSPNRAYLAPCL